jgi:hypothetical protein
LGPAQIAAHYLLRTRADGTAFGTTDFTDQVTLPGLGTLPRNVATICQLTWECVPPPQGPNEHANAAGYHVIADAFLAAAHPWARP